MTYIKRLSEHWEALGVLPVPPGPPSRTDAFAQRHNVSIPHDFRAFYAFCDGIDSTDNGLNAFWRLDEIDTVPNKLSDFRRRS